MLKDIPIVTFSEQSEQADISYNPSDPFINGRQMLIQRIVKLIFTKKGSNVYNPDIGTNFIDLFSTVTLDQQDSAEQAFPVMVKNLEDQIKQMQLNSSLQGGTIPPSQKLVSLTLESTEFDRQLGG